MRKGDDLVNVFKITSQWFGEVNSYKKELFTPTGG